jgi:hypothetical protein
MKLQNYGFFGLWTMQVEIMDMKYTIILTFSENLEQIVKPC